MNHSRFVPSVDDPAALRRAFGRFGTGVTIVTTLSERGPLGMTANSFSSVSLDPPLVLWSPARWSERHDSFTSADRFCIHVLKKGQEPLAQVFAKDGLNFGNVDWSACPHGVPILSGCAAVFRCTTHAVHPAGDHSIVVGEVCEVLLGDEDVPGLMFERGRFGQFQPDP